MSLTYINVYTMYMHEYNSQHDECIVYFCQQAVLITK